MLRKTDIIYGHKTWLSTGYREWVPVLMNMSYSTYNVVGKWHTIVTPLSVIHN